MKYSHKHSIPLLTLLTLAGTLSCKIVYAQSSSPPRNSDFCFMRTAEGEYRSLNYLCQPASSDTTTPDETTAPQARPIQTSTPAQTPSDPTQSVSPEDAPFSSDNQDPIADDVPDEVPRNEAPITEDSTTEEDPTDAAEAPFSEPTPSFPENNAVPSESSINRTPSSSRIDRNNDIRTNQELPTLD